jgi:large subunit ribosomal protein L30
MSSAKQLKLTLIKSKHGRTKGHAECIRGLGLRRIRHSVVVQNTPENRGMVNKVSYLLDVEEVA